MPPKPPLALHAMRANTLRPCPLNALIVLKVNKAQVELLGANIVMKVILLLMKALQVAPPVQWADSIVTYLHGTARLARSDNIKDRLASHNALIAMLASTHLSRNRVVALIVMQGGT
jgi:hypothetical protein